MGFFSRRNCVSFSEENWLMKQVWLWCLIWVSAWNVAAAQQRGRMDYRVEVSAFAGEGGRAPLWLSANRYGLYGVKDRQVALRTGLGYRQSLTADWKVEAGLELAGGWGLVSDCWLQQAFAEVEWKDLQLRVGSKECPGFPLEKNPQLSSGWMVEGMNARPIPQVRLEVPQFWSVPGLGDWLALKGHLAYGRFLDGEWQEGFVAYNRLYTKEVHYHSKSVLFRLGKRRAFPLELEFGLLMANQFGGKQYRMNGNGEGVLLHVMPAGWKSYWRALLPQRADASNPIQGEQNNIEGNVVGSWNFALNGYVGDWRLRTYYEHYFEDHSQMFWQYGRWKDGMLGVEVTPPANRWLNACVWEMVCTKDQTGPFEAYSSYWPGEDFLLSGGDNYYNHYVYQAWQYYGMGMGNPLIPGPIYNVDGALTFRSNRVKGHHVGLGGCPSKEWNWRMLASWVRHWGTYSVPLDKQRKQFSGLVEVTFCPSKMKGWRLSASVALDRGKYLGNSWGGMISLSKSGGFGL